MASANFSYYKLKQESWLIDEESKEERSLRKIRRWSEITRSLGRRRPKVQIPGLRRFLRKKKRFFNRLKVSWRKALKRLKNGQVHMNDLFGGTYLVMQFNYGTTLRCGERPYMGHGLHGMPSRQGRIA
ncbi:hypothetical protein SO802_020293 [Lithocarpus litseifolius]|uniref:Ribosomal protein S19 n=1 Tax=Lithocarpus litseifolius TaxID=425828 RepID=A0AAW2CBZ5_9ROSI